MFESFFKGAALAAGVAVGWYGGTRLTAAVERRWPTPTAGGDQSTTTKDDTKPETAAEAA